MQRVAVTPSTMPELLAAAAAPGRGGWFFHSGHDVTALPVKDLYARALKRATDLARADVGRGTNVGLVGQNCPEWAEWAWATWLAGATLVPLPAPVVVGGSFGEQVSSLVAATGCSVVVGEKRYLDLLVGEHFAQWDWSAQAPRHPFLSPATTSSGPGATGDHASTAGATEVSPSDLAVVLCTSWSTAAPKGVRMSHARALEWARQNALHPQDGAVPAMVNWFPFFHIAGLGLLFQVVTPVDQHIVAMKHFLADPASWLRLVSETGASHVVSPSSIWSEVLEAVVGRPEGIDLSHLEQLAFNAELADPDMVARVRDVCGPRGLHPGTITVHYASSEAGMISRTTPGHDPRVDSVDLAELVRSGHALAARPGQPVKRVVSCGRPYPGGEICVGGPGRPLPEREVGDVWVRGPGVTDGYVNLHDSESFAGGWLRVGDLAYMDQGELFVTGRSDEVVVHLGEKYHPEDIERAVLQVTGLSPRACAAFSRQDGQAGEFVVVVEADHLPDLPRRASAAIADAVGIAPSEVLVVPHGTVPTTPNGKLQRSKLRQMHARGELDQWRT